MAVSFVPTEKVKAEEVNSVVSKNGQLRVSGNQLVNQAGEAIQLKGMSSHGLQWFGQFSNYDSMKWLRDNWGMTVFRAAMYTQDGGYINDPSQKNKVKQAVQNAIDLGIYVIIDWHVLGEQDPNVYKQQAKGFFSEMASLYKDYPNVIYEICNEPNGSATTWNGKIKPYAEEVIPVIRSIAPGSIIIVGTGTWSQDVQDAANNPLYYSNIMYTTHFYAGTHGQWLRDRIDYARSKGVAVFITEWGTSDASGDGGPFLAESKVWTDFMQDRKISWANWSLCDKSEVSAALVPGASPYGGWSDAQLTASGKFVKDQMYGSSQPPSDGIVSGKIYKLVNVGSGKVLDVTAAGTSDGTNVQIWDDNGTGAQQWVITDVGGGLYNVINVNSNKGLDVAGTVSGSNVQIWSYGAGANQKWKIVKVGSAYKLIASHNGKALDVASAGTENGTNVQIWDDNGSNAQNWNLYQLN
ncbi:cellulase family glycosylhydrolase [Paenibacillus sp. FSL E2-8871]|uniref:cellulase family glycosylhydrolase n=1 Tax=Paenibacillus sp. FSL E2-8871 TaxID=2975326 RepID=UPI0030FAB9B4